MSGMNVKQNIRCLNSYKFCTCADSYRQAISKPRRCLRYKTSLIINSLTRQRGHETFGVQCLFEHPAIYQIFSTMDTRAVCSLKSFI
jgi:hypothetical protein